MIGVCSPAPGTGGMTGKEWKLMSDKTSPAKKTSIGGQALIEGIMMRGPEVTAMAVRHVSGEIVLESWPTGGTNKPRFLKLPFIRGIFNFIDSLRYGYKCLMRSAELSGLEEEEDPPQAQTACATASPSAQAAVQVQETENRSFADGGVQTAVAVAEVQEPEQPQQAQREEQRESVACANSDDASTPHKAQKEESKGEKFLMTFLMTLSGVLGVALAVVLFMWLPAFLFNLLAGAVPAVNHNVYRGIFEGVFRIALFIGYMLLVSLMKDIRRVFMYHGAEHKAIFCYEAGEELTVENVRKQRRFHPRCGTSFMILMLLVGVVVSILIPSHGSLVRTGIKLLTIPLVVSVGYELIKLAGRTTNWFTRAISAPGLWLQRITTKEPDDGMIECAIEALTKVIPEDPEADKW